MKERPLPIVLALTLAPVAAAEVTVHGALTADLWGVSSSSESFLNAGWGRFGADGGDSNRTSASLVGELGLVWEVSPSTRLVAHGLGRLDGSHLGGGEVGGDTFGLVEVFVDYRVATSSSSELGLRGGVFFPPTSFENVDERWGSPYTLTFSAINSWVAEEARDLGLETRWSHQGTRGRFTVGVAALGGNDTSGTLLAWRGFSLHDRVTVIAEVLPLPPLAGLAEGGGFAIQRDDGTRPIGRDLDGRLGWSARVAWRDDERGWNTRVRVADNRGDREEHRGEYAWRTRTIAAGSSAALGARWTVAGEVLAGDSGMGVAPVFVDIDFAAAYVLLSRKAEKWRVSARFDQFRVRDRDFSSLEVSDEDGQSVTLAVLREHGGWRLGLEAVVLDIERPPASGFAELGDGTTLRLELRRSL